jgi:hypothetical protein
MKNLFIFTLLMLICYLGCAFITLELNPLQWSQTVRIFYILFGFVFSVLVTDLVFNLTNTNHKELMGKLKEEMDKFNLNEK